MPDAEKDALVCKHCDRPLAENGTHAEGRQRGKNRCDSDDSGLPYGYDAAPVGEPCSHACLGYEPPCPDCGLDPDDDTVHRAGCRRIFPRGHPLERLQFGPPYEPWTRKHWAELEQARLRARVLPPAEGREARP